MSILRIMANEGEALSVGDFQKAIDSIDLLNIGFFKRDCTDEELRKLEESLNAFDELNYSEYSDDAILDHFINALQVDCVFTYTPQPFFLTKGEVLFRVRSASYEKLPCKKLKNEADCWNPPEAIAPQGRLNKLHESLLYTTLGNPSICFDECNIQSGNQFMLMVYSVCDEMEFSLIGARLHPKTEKELSPNGLRYHQICTSFLNSYFSKPVDKCDKEYYRVTELLAKHIFTSKENGQRAWGYATVVGENSRGLINLCMDPILAKKHLQLAGVVFGTRVTKNSLKIDGIVESFDTEGKPIYISDTVSTDLYQLLVHSKEKYGLDYDYLID